MDHFKRTQFRLRRLSWWQVALVASIAAALVIALAIVTAGLILILAPIIFLAVLFRRLTASRSTRRSDVGAGPSSRVIEAEYEVIDVSAERIDKRDR